MVLFPGTAIQQGPQSQEAHTSQLSMSTIVTLSVVIVMLTSLQAWTRFGSCARYWSTRTLCDKHKQRGSVYNGNADIICTRGIVCLTRSSKPFPLNVIVRKHKPVSTYGNCSITTEGLPLSRQKQKTRLSTQNCRQYVNSHLLIQLFCEHNVSKLNYSTNKVQ